MAILCGKNPLQSIITVPPYYKSISHAQIKLFVGDFNAGIEHEKHLCGFYER